MFDWAEMFWALKNTTLQAFISSTASLAFGTFLATGLLRLNSRVLEYLYLLPALLPSVFALLFVFYWVNPFPFGILGIALVHTVINAGATGVALAKTVQDIGGDLPEMALVSGSSRWFFWRHFTVGTLRPFMKSQFRFLFTMAFISFSIPLLTGGGWGTTLEVLLYEKVKISGDWAAATGIAIFQLVFLYLVRVPNSIVKTVPAKRGTFPKKYTSRISLAAGVLFSLLFVYTLTSSWLFPWWSKVPLAGVVESLIGSVIVWSLVVILTLVLCFGSALLLVQGRLAFLKKLAAPSSMVIAFAIYQIGPNTPAFAFIKSSLILSFTNYLLLFHFRFWPLLQSYQMEWDVGRVCGATPIFFLDRVFFRRWIGPFCQIAAISGVWSLGDFAISRILFENDATLGLLLNTLITGYRIDLALGLSVVLAGLGLLSFLLLTGVAFVFDKRT